MKLKWTVDSPPTGRYRSFERRGWPSAEYDDGRPAARILCEDDYVPSRVKTGNHKPLNLWVADYSAPSNKMTGSGFTWRAAIGTYPTLQAAKDASLRLLEKFPHLVPKVAVGPNPEGHSVN